MQFVIDLEFVIIYCNQASLTPPGFDYKVLQYPPWLIKDKKKGKETIIININVSHDPQLMKAMHIHHVPSVINFKEKQIEAQKNTKITLFLKKGPCLRFLEG